MRWLRQLLQETLCAKLFTPAELDEGKGVCARDATFVPVSWWRKIQISGALGYSQNMIFSSNLKTDCFAEKPSLGVHIVVPGMSLFDMTLVWS